jgi:hypothetical protein
MRGYVEYLLCGYTGALTEEQTKCLAKSRESSIKLEGNIETLMDLLAFHLKLVPEQKDLLDFGTLMKGWTSLFQGIAKAKKRKVHGAPFSEDVWLWVDSKWMKTFWTKFLESLCDTLPGRGDLHIVAEKKGDRIIIVLSGNWGAAWDLLEKWNRPDLLGAQADDSIKRINVFQFALAKEILRFHGGELKTRPRPGGKGSGDILVSLPTSKAPRAISTKSVRSSVMG